MPTCLPRPRRSPSPLGLALATGFLLAAGGCGRGFQRDPYLGEASGAVVPREANAPRALFMFEGSTGRSLGWADVMEAASRAHAVFIGERHDDPTGHRVQLAVYEDLLAGYPGTALALEHLERNEQATVDRYLRGEITADEFIDSTESRNWAGKDTWVAFFQPMIDVARDAKAPVVAANAPRDDVRLAREIGPDAMMARPADQRVNFDMPVTKRSGFGADDWNARWQAYQGRFRAIMSGDGEDPDSGEARARLDSVFLSQSTWDGTMGASAAKALEAGAPKVVLCAGCFHVERDGGTVLQFEARRPRAEVLTITVIDDTSDRLRDDDRGAADIVIYGFPVARKPRETAPATPKPTAPAADTPVQASGDAAQQPPAQAKP